MPAPNYNSKTAIISPCGLYRYSLRRCWEEALPPFVIGMLNPSTADAEIDDPTIARVVRRAERLGLGSLIVWNLYAYRATDPAHLVRVADPAGPQNRHWIRQSLKECYDRSGIAAVGWGAGGADKALTAEITRIAREVGITLQCFGMTKDGHPRHPLYVSYGTPLQPWGLSVAGPGVGAV